MAEKWKAGDVVNLKSGGPDMTVNCYNQVGLVNCHWFDNTKLLSGNFEENQLEAVEED